MEGVGKMCVFSTETVRDTAKVNILITNRKCHTPCQMRGKSLTLDDFEGH